MRALVGTFRGAGSRGGDAATPPGIGKGLGTAPVEAQAPVSAARASTAAAQTSRPRTPGERLIGLIVLLLGIGTARLGHSIALTGRLRVVYSVTSLTPRKWSGTIPSEAAPQGTRLRLARWTFITAPLRGGWSRESRPG